MSESSTVGFLNDVSVTKRVLLRAVKEVTPVILPGAGNPEVIAPSLSFEGVVPNATWLVQGRLFLQDSGLQEASANLSIRLERTDIAGPILTLGVVGGILNETKAILYDTAQNIEITITDFEPADYFVVEFSGVYETISATDEFIVSFYCTEETTINILPGSYVALNKVY